MVGGGVQHGAGKGVRGTRMGGGDQLRSSGRGVHSPARPLLAAAAHSSVAHAPEGRVQTGIRRVKVASSRGHSKGGKGREMPNCWYRVPTILLSPNTSSEGQRASREEALAPFPIYCGGDQRPPKVGLKVIRQARGYGWPAHGTFEPQILHVRGGRCATTDSRWGLPCSRAGAA